MDQYDVIQCGMRGNGVLLSGTCAGEMNVRLTGRRGTTDQV